jgi:hypothetical protein
MYSADLMGYLTHALFALMKFLTFYNIAAYAEFSIFSYLFRFYLFTAIYTVPIDMYMS